MLGAGGQGNPTEAACGGQPSGHGAGKGATEGGSGDGKGQTDRNQNMLVYNLNKGIYWMRSLSLEYGHL